jgi:hypothetical protein
MKYVPGEGIKKIDRIKTDIEKELAKISQKPLLEE